MIEQRLEIIGRQVDQIHTTLFGMEQEGGLVRDVKHLHECIHKLDHSLRDLEHFKWKIIGAASIIGMLGSHAISLIAKHL